MAWAILLVHILLLVSAISDSKNKNKSTHVLMHKSRYTYTFMCIPKHRKRTPARRKEPTVTPCNMISNMTSLQA